MEFGFNLYYKVFGDGTGRLICGWLGVVVARHGKQT